MVRVLTLLICILTSSVAHSDDVFNPNFFEYKSNGVISRIVEFSFGWNKKLSPRELDSYHGSLMVALEHAENGIKVNWYENKASGYSQPVFTWPVSNGYCRRLHLSVIAHNKQKSKAVTACFNNMDSNWTWHRE